MLIASSSNFANANNNGNANNNYASNVGGVRPLLRRYQETRSQTSEQGMSVYPSFLVNKCHDATAYGRCRYRRGILTKS